MVKPVFIIYEIVGKAVGESSYIGASFHQPCEIRRHNVLIKGLNVYNIMAHNSKVMLTEGQRDLVLTNYNK